MRNKLHILLNILWNITGMGMIYAMFFSIFDFIYIITCKGALDRFRVSAYFAPFDYKCHWKKRFPYVDYPKRPKKQKETIRSVSEMYVFEFVTLVWKLLETVGYKNVKKISDEFGTFFLAQKPVGSQYENVCVLCKKHDKPVIDTAVQEAYQVKKHYNCEISIVVTNSVFTPKAIKLAQKCDVLLWDKHTLNDIFKKERLPYCLTKKAESYKIKTDYYEDDNSLTYEEIDNYDILDE